MNILLHRQALPEIWHEQRAAKWRKFLKMTTGWMFFICCLLGPDLLPAQSLKDLLAQLPQANPELRALYLDYQAALAVAPQVSQLPDPELKLGWYTLSPETRLGPQRLWWILNQKLPWPGKLKAQEELALTRATPLLEKVAVRQLLL
ncbi:MAG: hypothetical protein KDD15_30500, partial [Lewinella sp.]|nr:hypothetical protein [Lewinella sp.]